MTSTTVFRIRCYVSVITEKYDLSFQLTYHTLAFDAEGQALFDMSEIQQTVVLDLRTSNILISALPTIDQIICHEKISFQRQSENTKNKEVLYTENTLHWRKIEMVNAR